MRGPAARYPTITLAALTAWAVLAGSAAIALAGSPPLGTGTAALLLTGNDQALWLVRPGEEKTFDIAVRPAGAAWKLVGHDLPGVVQAAAAVDSHVHLFLSNPFAHLILHEGDEQPTQAPSPRDDRWPTGAPILAAFPMSDPNNRSAAAALVVVVADTGGRSTMQSAPARGPASRAPVMPRGAANSAPSEAPALTSLPATGENGALPTRAILHVFRYADGEWQHVAEYPPEMGSTSAPAAGAIADESDAPQQYANVLLTRQTRVLGTAAEGMIYLHVSEPGRAPRLARWDGTVWEALPALPPAAPAKATTSLGAEAPAATASASSPARTGPATPTGQTATSAPGPFHGGDAQTVFAMLCLDGRAVLLRALPAPQPARWRVQLASLSPPLRAAGGEKEVFHIQDVRFLGPEAPWEEVDFASSPLLATRLGNQIALLWTRQDHVQMGAVNLTGQFVPLGNVEVFQPEPPTGRGEDLLNYIALGALVVSSLLTFQLRGRVPLRPLVLPAGVAVADPFRRLLAGLIDLMPLLALAGEFFPLPPISLQELLQRAQEGRIPDSMFYAKTLGVCVYAVYCILMELRFGTTLGGAILRIRVANDQGQPATFAQIALRNVLKIFELLWPGVPVLLLWPLLTRSRQRMGDMIARTVVIVGKPRQESPGGNEPNQEP